MANKKTIHNPQGWQKQLQIVRNSIKTCADANWVHKHR